MLKSTLFCDICNILVRCLSAASPFVVPLRAGFVVSPIVHCFSFASFRQGGVVCDGKRFSIFSGISFVISYTIDSLNLLGMPGLLPAGLMGRGGSGRYICYSPFIAGSVAIHVWDLSGRFLQPVTPLLAASCNSAVSGVVGFLTPLA